MTWALEFFFFRPFIIGFIASALLKVLSILISYSCSESPSFSYSLTSISFLSWAPYFIWFFICLYLNSLNEEMVYRSFPLQFSKDSDLEKYFQVIGYAIFFSIMHFILEKPDLFLFLYRFSFGLLVGCLFLKNRSLWQIVGFHTGWNFMALSFSDSDWRNGGLVNLMGIESSTAHVANISVLILGLIFFQLITKKPEVLT